MESCTVVSGFHRHWLRKHMSMFETELELTIHFPIVYALVPGCDMLSRKGEREREHDLFTWLTSNTVLRKRSISPFSFICWIEMLPRVVARFQGILSMEGTVLACVEWWRRRVPKHSCSSCVKSHGQCRGYPTHVLLSVKFFEVPKPFYFLKKKPWPNSTVDFQATSRWAIQSLREHNYFRRIIYGFMKAF